jgi:hypothetical protein
MMARKVSSREEMKKVCEEEMKDVNEVLLKQMEARKRTVKKR